MLLIMRCTSISIVYSWFCDIALSANWHASKLMHMPEQAHLLCDDGLADLTLHDFTFA